MSTAGIGTVLGFLLGCLLKFHVSLGSETLFIGFRAFSFTGFSANTADTYAFSFIVSLIIASGLAVLGNFIGRQVGDMEE